MTPPRTAAIIVAAGQGLRAGGTVPKQFAPLGGKPMLAHSVAAFLDHPAVSQVIVAIGEGQEALLAGAVGEIAWVTGGATRRLSVLAALEALAHDPPARVLIHDAARPFLPRAVIDRLLGHLAAEDGACPVLPVADTLVHRDGHHIPRDDLYRVQTPQAFLYDVVLTAHRRWPEGTEPTDDAQMVRHIGHRVALVEGDAMLDKITHSADFAAAEARLAANLQSRTATGFDVHRLEAGEDLWLGGVLIPHDKGLSGHSDADVALHAITDALLGTIAEGDIGTHFPPSDPQWRGADSARFLQHAAGLIEARGGIIDFVDLTLLCEEPKIGPHRVAMQARIATLLRLATTQVSIKATTTERLGFTGRGEGIAAQAAATVRVPGDKV